VAKKVIGIDLDDVISYSALGYVSFSNERWGTKLTADDYTEHWDLMWNVGIKEVARRSDEIHRSGRIAKFDYIQESLPVLKKLKLKYKLVILTSRRRMIHDETIAWLDRYFKDVFDDIHYSGIYDELKPGSLKLTKGELSRQIGADYLIDDQIKHVFAAAEVGIKGILFGPYRWNRSEELPPLVTRCETWTEVEEYFDGES
jgi:5'(3')-deoxyribonucleotidase